MCRDINILHMFTTLLLIRCETIPDYIIKNWNYYARMRTNVTIYYNIIRGNIYSHAPVL